MTNPLPFYNLSFVHDVLRDHPEEHLWRERFDRFFSNIESTNPALMDQYYDILLYNANAIRGYLDCPLLYSSFTGLFSFDHTPTNVLHTFGIAAWFKANHIHFRGKTIGTIIGDFGLINLQLAFSGLNLSGCVAKDDLGCVLTCIGNEGFPYPLGGWTHPTCDVIIAANVFANSDDTARYLPFLLRSRRDGKEVYLVSETYHNLFRFHESIQPGDMEYIPLEPSVHTDEEYTILKMGWTNKIYRLK